MMDDWGRNPEVKRMRRVFQEMETGQEKFLRSMRISPFDARLRIWREKARVLFDRLWPRAVSHGNMDEDRMGRLYVHCLGRIMNDDGVPVPEGLLPEDEEIQDASEGRPVMIRLRLFGRCRIYHDPVSPVLRAPAEIGWDAWFRKIDLVTPRRLKGRELLMRTRGWWTVEPSDVLPVVEKHGRLVVGENGELMVECGDADSMEALRLALKESFEDQVLLSP